MAESDFSQLHTLFKDLTEVGDLVQSEVKKSLQQTAIETKESWAADASKGVLGKRYAPTIDFEEREFGAFGQGVLEVVIGPNLERYGGKTGRGGLVPSAGIFDDPLNQGKIRSTPSRARQRAEKFAEAELAERIRIAVDRSLKQKRL